MTDAAKRLVLLAQAGFDVDQWNPFDFHEQRQRQLVGVICNDPSATVLKLLGISRTHSLTLLPVPQSVPLRNRP